MQFSIRTAREDDAESIVELLNPIIRAGTYTIMAEQLSVDDQIDYIGGFPERGVYNVAVCDDSRRVLGIQDVRPASTEEALKHVGEISTFVALALRRNGIGRGLSRATFEAAKGRGFRKLMATIRADNPHAVSFYRRQGFTVIGMARSHALVRGTYVDEILTERWLDSDQGRQIRAFTPLR
jgi:L-amino acid N-acyltransferase YncA